VPATAFWWCENLVALRMKGGTKERLMRASLFLREMNYDSIVPLWDLRSGMSIHHFCGHTKRVLCTEFSLFQLSTADDDGTIKICGFCANESNLHRSQPFPILSHSYNAIETKVESF
jgi:WD40 repeat protein